MKKITVVIVGSVYHNLMKFSIDSTLKSTPDVEEVITISDKPVYDTAKFIELRPGFNRDDYADFVLKQLWPIIKTEFILCNNKHRQNSLLLCICSSFYS